MIATGRNPNTEGPDLELTGVELTDRGYIKANERLQTTAPVWAIGEVAGNPQFTHISVDDFRVVHANLSGGNRVTTRRRVPYWLFTDPELAHIGLSETEAEPRGIAYRLFKVPMGTNLRARTPSETRGFVKALVEGDSDRILGFTAFGVGAGEILAAVQMATIRAAIHRLRDVVLTTQHWSKVSHICSHPRVSAQRSPADFAGLSRLVKLPREADSQHFVGRSLCVPTIEFRTERGLLSVHCP